MPHQADYQRVAARYAAARVADLSPPLGYPGGNCYLMERVREDAPAREQAEIIDKIESGEPLNLQDSARIYDLEGERGPRGSSFKSMVLKPHAQYRMDQRGVTVADLKRYFENFQREWSKRKSQKRDKWTEAVAGRQKIQWADPKTKLFAAFLPLNPKQVALVTTYWDPADTPPRAVPEQSCDHWDGWAKDNYPVGLDRILPKNRKADLQPPLGFPGGPCHLMSRIHEEVSNVRMRESLVDRVEAGKELTNPQAHKVYDMETERGLAGSLFTKLLLTAHVQYRMDQRGITVAELRLALKGFAKEFHKQKSMQSVQARVWQEEMAWGEEIKWKSSFGLTVVFTATKEAVKVITAYWEGQSDPRPKDESECGLGKQAGSLGDCYEANGRYFMAKNLLGEDANMKLVHGEVTGQGSLEGVNYGHAWVEDGNTVIDVSNGKNLRMPKAVYYALGGIDRNDNLHKYSASDFRRKVSDHEHWGPWDLRTSTGL